MADSVKDSIDINATAEEIFAVATDFETYPEWNDAVKAVEILERDEHGRGIRVQWEVDARIKVLKYILALDYAAAPESYSWTLESGDLKSLTGSYTFDELGDSTETTYEFQIDTGFPVPGFLKRQAEKQILTTALDGLKERVEKR